VELVLAHRPIRTPGEIGLKDLWAYQADQQSQSYAAERSIRRMDYVIGIIRELAEQDQPVDQSGLPACATFHVPKACPGI